MAARQTYRARLTALAPVAAALLLAACGTTSLQEDPQLHPMPAPRTQTARTHRIDPDLPAMPAAGSGRGGYYQDDGPGDNPPPNLRDTPDAEVRAEPYSRNANKPYVVFGKTYTPLLNDEPFEQRGVSTWYGKKFHGQRTSSGEIYDMYKMTAAHPTLPIPSYARITSMDSGKQVIVRINDRGPFHSSRIVDVSYTAALKLGLLGKGSHEVKVERVLPNAQERIATTRRNAQPPDEAPQVITAPVDAPPVLASSPIDEPPAAALRGTLAPAAAVATPIAPVDPAVGPSPGFYVQLGAFSRPDRANEIRAQLAAAGGSLSVVELVQSGALHRLFSGPFPSRADAMKALLEVPAALGLKPIVVRR